MDSSFLENLENYIGEKKGEIKLSANAFQGYNATIFKTNQGIEKNDIIKIGEHYYLVTSVEDYLSNWADKVELAPALKRGVSTDETIELYSQVSERKTIVSRREEREKIIIKKSSRTTTDSNKYEDYINTVEGRDGYYFKVYEIRTYSDNTVERVLLKNNVDRVEPIPTVTTKGTKPIHTTKTRYEDKKAAEIKEEIVYDENLIVGKREIIEQGSPDIERITYLQHFNKGVFAYEEIVSRSVTERGRPKIIRVGTKKTEFIWRRLKVVKTNGEVIYTGHELINGHTKDIENQISENNAVIRDLYDSELSDLRGELAKQEAEVGKKVSEKEIKEAERKLLELINRNSLTITQTNDSFTQEYSRIEASIKNNELELEKLAGVIQSGLDSNGNTYTDWIGDDENRVRVGSDGIVMLSNNAETLKLKDGRGYMNSLYVEHELGLGNHTARKMGTEFTVFMPIGGQK